VDAIFFSPFPMVSQSASQMLSTRSPVDHGHRLASCDTSLVVSSGVDCGRRRRNVCISELTHFVQSGR